MSRENRAKQFMPFAALTGHKETIALREKEILPKRELTEERKGEIDMMLRDLKPATMVRVEFYDRDGYVSTTGMFSKVDSMRQTIRIVTEEISLDDIYNIEIL